MRCRQRRSDQAGMTLLELVISAAILAVLAAAAMPLMEVTVRRSREVELRRSLRMLRRAIDDFHESYVASGGATSQGPTNIPGLQPQPLSGTPTPPQASGMPPPTGAAPGGSTAAIPLIDVSEFDPVDCKGYPPSLKILVEGVPPFGGLSEDKVKFLRRIPLDPMLSAQNMDPNDENYGWGVRSYQDDYDANVWGRQNVYDVYSKSSRRALDGTYYWSW